MSIENNSFESIETRKVNFVVSEILKYLQNGDITSLDKNTAIELGFDLNEQYLIKCRTGKDRWFKMEGELSVKHELIILYSQLNQTQKNNVFKKLSKQKNRNELNNIRVSVTGIFTGYFDGLESKKGQNLPIEVNAIINLKTLWVSLVVNK
jgi:hypothetical protein